MNQFGDAYKKLEALGDRERVLAVWPDAKLVGYHDGACAIFSQMATETRDTGYLGWGQSTFNRNSTQAESQAWADAASRLPVVAEPAKGVLCKCDCHNAGRGFCDSCYEDHLIEPNPPQPDKPEALMSDEELSRFTISFGVVSKIAKELQAWRAWAKNGGGR